MADISVSLELDDSKYTSRLKAAENAAKSFGTSVSGALGAVKTGTEGLVNGVELLNGKFETLTKVIVGVGIAEFAKSLLEGAKNLKDLSNAVNVNTSTLMEMGVAAVTSGGNIDKIAQMLNKMEIAAGAAAAGNMDLRKAFNDVGVSFQDMKTKSPDEIFNQIAKRLGELQGTAQGARIQMELFGRGARGFSFAEYSKSIQDTAGTMGEFGESQRKAAELGEKLELKLVLIKAAFVEMLSPVFDLISGTTNMSVEMEHAKTIAEGLGIALGLFVGAQVISAVNGLVTLIKSLATAFGFATTSIAASTIATGVNTDVTITNAGVQAYLAGALGRVGTAQGAVAVAQIALDEAMATGIATTAELTALQNALAAAEIRLSVARQGLIVTAGELSTVNTLLAGTSTAAAAGTDAMVVSSTALGARFAILTPLLTAAAAALGFFYSKELNTGEDAEIEKMHKLNAALQTFTKEQQDAYYKLDAQDQKRIQDMIINQAEAQKIQDAMNKIKPAATLPGGSTLLGSTPVKDLTLPAKEQADQIGKQTDNLNRQNQVMLARIKLQGDLAFASAADRDAALAAFDAQAKAANEMFRIDTEISKVRKQMATEGTDKAQQQALQLVIDAYEKQKVQLKDIADAAAEVKKQEVERANAAQMATYFIEQQQKATQDLKQINYDIADLTKSTTQKQLESIDRLIIKEGDLAVAKRRAQLGPNGEVSAEEELAIRQKIADTYAPNKRANEELIAQSRKFDTGWTKAWNDYIDNATNGAKNAEQLFTKSMQGMEDAIVNFAKTGKFEWKLFVASLAEELLRQNIKGLIANVFGGVSQGGSGSSNNVLGSIWSGVKSIFGFANGGQVMGGQPILVGERGPELFMPPSGGNIVPNNQLTGTTKVTYNINAVDAASFKAMIARDPRFLYAVTEQGRKTVGTR